MPHDTLSVFTSPLGQTFVTKSGWEDIPDDKKTPIQKLADKFKASLKVKVEEDEALRKEGKMAQARALDFPYEIVTENSPQDKIRLTNGVNTYLIVTVDPVYQRLEFSKYSFNPAPVETLINELLSGAGYQVDPKAKDCLTFGSYIRPSGF